MRIQDASRIFSSAKLQALAHGDLSFVRMVAESQNLISDGSNIRTVGSVFDNVFFKMLKDYRNEYVFKNKLVESAFLKKYSTDKATIVTELRVGRCVADAVLINGTSTCFEIKTEFDTLNRLSEQLAAYRTIFDKVIIVASESHLSELQNQLHEGVGLTILTKNAALKVITKPIDLSSQPIDVSVLTGTLRLKELEKLARSLTNKKLPTSNIDVYDFCRDVLNKADHKKVRQGFRSVIKSCRKQNAELLSNVPISLKNACVSYNFSVKEIDGLLRSLKYPIT